VQYDQDRIVAYNKQARTPHMRHIDYGLGMFRRSAFDRVPQNSFYDLAILYQEMLNQDQLAAHEVSQRFYEIGSLSGLEELKAYLASQAVSGRQR
jgi:hypothetical protein